MSAGKSVTPNELKVHTPGPWSVSEERGSIEIIGDGQSICELWRRGRVHERPDARLMAASPDLLTAAQIAYTILGDIRHEWKGRHTHEGQGALVALRDAISRATGRHPEEVQDEYACPQRAA